MSQSSSISTQLNLVDLPVEILTSICKNFYGHCQGEFANNNLEAIAGKYGNDERQAELYKGPRDDEFEAALLPRIRTPLPEIASLKSLMRTCRLLGAVAEPFIYHSLFIKSGEELLPRLLQTLFKKPNLASGIYEVYLDDGEACKDERYRYSRVDQAEAVFSLIKLTPNLDQLFLGMMPGHLPKLFNMLATQASTLHKSKLRCLYFSFGYAPTPLHPAEIDYDDDDDGDVVFPLDLAAPLLKFAAPHLQFLKLSSGIHVSESFAASLGRRTLQDRAPLHSLVSLRLDQCLEGNESPARPINISSFHNLMKAVGPHLSNVWV